MYSKNITGPKTVPCGIPDNASTKLEAYSSITTL